MMGFSVGLTH